MATNSVLAKLAVVISANTAQFSRELTATRKDLNSFTSGITKLTGALGIAFSVQQVASFALEVSKLSGEAEGVTAAFERLPQSTKLMNDLKAATGNTVSELGLMKRAVQASNFDISLQALPRLLEFATLRAQQTGQSVDYLVDSIVTGIGRKSKLILDNLGISAVQLDEALGGASTAASTIGEVADAVGKIAEENLKNMAGFSDNASTKLQKLAASWENVKVSIGDASNSTGILGGVVDELTASLNVLASKNLSFLEKIAAFGGFGTGIDLATQLDQIRNQQKVNAEQKKQEQIIREVDRAFKEFNGDIDAYGRAIETHIYRTELLAEFTKRLTKEQDDQVVTLESLQAQQKELNDMFAQTDANDQKKLVNIAEQIAAVNKQIEALEKLKKLESADFSNIGFKVPEFGDVNFTEEDFQDQSIDISIKPEDIESLNAGIDAILGLQYAYDGLQFSIDTSNEAQKEMQDEMMHTADIAANMGEVIGEAFGEAISGQKKFADAMASLIPQLLKLFLGEAMAAIIAAGAKQGAKSGNAIVGVAAAAAGAAAIGALFSKHTGGSSGSVGASVGFNSSKFGGIEKNNEIKITIDGRIQGTDIVYILNRTEQLNGRTRD